MYSILAITIMTQLFFFIRVSERMHTYLNMVEKSISDSIPFMIILGIILTCFLVIFTQLGVRFDDGNNYTIKGDDKYKSDFDDYPHVTLMATLVLGQLRNALGDPSPPAYDWWRERYNNDVYKFNYSTLATSISKDNVTREGKNYTRTNFEKKGFDTNVANLYIILIWFFWFLQFYIVIIILLNLLIGIVSESLTDVLEKEAYAKVRARIALNEQF